MTYRVVKRVRKNRAASLLAAAAALGIFGTWYFVSSRAPGYADVTPFARAVVAAAPERVVWGTDWPHPAAHGLNLPVPNDGDLADMLLEWIPDEKQRRNVLVDNPARLYGFQGKR